MAILKRLCKNRLQNICEVFNVAKLKNKMIAWGNMLRNQNNLLEWMAVILIVIFSMFTMFYSDFQGTMNYAFQTVKQVMHGKFGSVLYLCSHPYGLTMAILLMIWVLPFYPFTTLVDGFEFYESVAGAAWSKLFLTIMTIFFIIGIYKNAKLIYVKEDNRRWIPLFVLTSAFYFVPVVEVGQCDIIALTFVMWGIYFYLKDDTKKFLLLFAIAIPMKYFALMIFVPLVLLREKNPLKIILQGIAGCSVLLLNVMVRKFVYGTVFEEFTSNAIGIMTNTVQEGNIIPDETATYIIQNTNTIEDYFGTFIANSSFFVVVFILICILAYSIKDNFKKWTFYIPFLVYASFFLFTSVNVYWSVLILPFISLVIFSNEKQLRLSMILETIAGWAFMFISCFSASWVVGGEKTFDYLFLKNLANGSDLHTFIEYELGLDGLLPYANSAYVACMIGILLVNLPCFVEKNEKSKDMKFDRWIIWGRIGILFCWVMLLIYLMLLR
jgi:hypothetical protein